MCKRLFIVLAFFALSGCALDTASDGFYVFNYSADFNQALDEWNGDFADYPTHSGDSTEYGLQTGIADLPVSGSSPERGLKGYMVSGSNRGNGLFMFIKRKVSSLTPNKEYTIVFDVEMMSNTPAQGNANDNIAAGSKVFTKVGAVNKNPMKVATGDTYRMNIDKGAQPSLAGQDMIVLGDCAVPSGSTTYTVIQRSNASSNSPMKVRTNGMGELWLIIGIDSAGEGFTTIYFKKIDVILSASN